MNVVLDPDKLQKYDNLSVEDVRQALIRREPGSARRPRRPGARRSWSCAPWAGSKSPKTSNDLIVANRNGYPIRLEDVGRVERLQRGAAQPEPALGEGADGRRARVGDDAVSLIVQKQSGENTVERRRARSRSGSPSSRRFFPPTSRLEVIRDQSRFIKNSIEEVQVPLVLAAVLVSLTILLFIRDWRTTLIATLAIPTSIIPTFAFMNYMGYTLNNMTMLGLILAIGIVIDDAVVVHENIFRHMEEDGSAAMEAAAAATREIALAVVATTLSLLVIFLPIAFMGGRVGPVLQQLRPHRRLRRADEPVRLLHPDAHALLALLSRLATVTRRARAGFVWRLVEHGYMALLGWSLRHRWLVIVATVGVLMSTPLLMKIVGTEFVPRDDQSEFEVAITLPEGYSLDRADQVFQEVEGRLQKLRGVTHSYTVVGDTTGRSPRAKAT